ncbi:MAG: DUF4249 family protein [Bacteroidota bacterium]
MPTFIPLDSLTIEKRIDDLSFDDGYYLIVHFSDIPNEQNYYQWEIYLNDEFISVDNIILNNDLTFEDQSVAFELPFSISLDDVIVGDTIKVLNYSLSKAAFDYYNGLIQLAESGSPALAIPDNPITNIKGGGLGFFNVCQIDSSFSVVEN